MATQRDILLALGYYDYRFHLGVAYYAREHAWHLAPDMAYHRDIPYGWRGDGIISKVARDRELADFVAGADLPVVNVGRDIGHDLPRILIDEKALARMAVEHFLSRRYENFAWCGLHPGPQKRAAPGPDDPRLRPYRFIRALRKAGFSCEVLDWEEARGKRPDAWPAERTWLAERLKALPKPLAVFCWDDVKAADVIQACRSAGLLTPEEIAVLGVNNDELICEALPVPLSSIDTDMEGRAYLAAQLLDRAMRGEQISQQTFVPPKGLVTRKSTDILATRNVGVARALRFIWENVHEPLRVAQVAKVAGITPRGLHKAFVAQLGRTPIEEIHRVRLLRAQKLLRESRDKIGAIAEKAGYDSAKNMLRAFQQQTGMTPRQYRQKHRAGD